MSLQTIYHRDGETVLFSVEAKSQRNAVIVAVQARAYLGNADLRGANLGNADLRAAYLRNADLRGADLGGADLRNAYLGNAALGGADLRGANLGNAYLGNADLGNADLVGANLGGADLGGADLRGAYLGNAYLGGADLRGAYLVGAYLVGANLGNADLGNAKGLDAARTTPLLMLLDQPGKIRAYKLVTSTLQSPMQHTGKLTYTEGITHQVKHADTDVLTDCGAGINVATLDWCLRHYQPGYRVMIVEFEAADIAAIPMATDGKFRLSKCTVVAEKDISALVAPKEASQ